MSQEYLSEQLNQETRASEPQLAELIQLAREVMLKKADKFYLSSDETQAHAGRHHNGWWLRNSFEKVLDDKHPKTPDKYELLLDLMPQPDTLRAIEKFGQDILDEAFDCLGEDASAKLAQLKETDDPSVIEEIIHWLVDRINDIEKEATFKYDSLDYQPVRLSPKLIGTYPNIAIPPTCLGKSILAASFFAKTDLPTLHAGVITPSRQEYHTTQSSIMLRALKSLESHDLDMPEDLAYTFAEEARLNELEKNTPRGFHAAIYVKIDETRWAQIDPNYGSSMIYAPTRINKLNNIFQGTAGAQKLDAPHVEVAAHLETNHWVFERMTELVIELIPDASHIEEILMSTPPEEIYSTLMQKVFKPLFFRESNEHPSQDKPLEELQFYINHFLSILSEGNENAYFQHIVSKFADKRFSYHEPKDLARCHTDKAYRERRISDVRIAPILMILDLHFNWVSFLEKTFGKGGDGNEAIEAGQPAYRIGITVLSDIAQFYGDELPLSTWLTYWASQVSYYEHRGRCTSQAQQKLAETALRFFAARPPHLTYPYIKDLIEKSTTEEV